MINFSLSDIITGFLNLLPSGMAWPKFSGSNLNALATAVATQFYRVIAIAQNMPADLNPATTVDFINEWQSSVGLPDPFLPVTGLANQQAQVVARLVGGGNPTIAFYQNFVGQLLGISPSLVLVTQFFPFVYQWSKYQTDTYNPLSSAFTSVVSVPSAYSAGIFLVTYELNRVAPAHCSVSVITY